MPNLIHNDNFVLFTNLTSFNVPPKSLSSSGMVLDGTYFTTTIPFLEFSIQFQSNNLIYDKDIVNDNRSFIFLSIIFKIEKGGVTGRYQNSDVTLHSLFKESK